MSYPAFTHDVFLSHTSEDKAVVLAVAERLRVNGVWSKVNSSPMRHHSRDDTTVRQIEIYG
jgi:hypothetical protein